MYLCYTLDKRAAPTEAARAAALAANVLGAKCSYDNTQEAIQHFSSAIQFDGTEHIYYANRSNRYQYLKSWKCAVVDARKVSISSK